MSGFAQHLREAIAINRERAEHYAVASEGRSRFLSEQLIASERATLPIATWLDRRAAPFNAHGIAVVQGDFVPMHPLPSWEQAPQYLGVSTHAHRRSLRRQLTALRRRGRRLSKTGAFARLANHCAEQLAYIRALERTEQAHFAMTAHIVESIGFGARNAAQTVAQHPQVRDLANDLMQVQLLGLRICIALDLQAQHLHAEGVGIVLNDVPAIPFPA